MTDTPTIDGERARGLEVELDREHPALGAHFTNAIRTGTYCTYRPETELGWIT